MPERVENRPKRMKNNTANALKIIVMYFLVDLSPRKRLNKVGFTKPTTSDTSDASRRIRNRLSICTNLRPST